MLHTAVPAQAETSLVFDTIDSERGLAQNTVTAVTQDSRGFLWVASQGGLQRFDGVRLMRIPLGGDARGVDALRGDAVISAILEDRQQQLWLSSANAGLAIFDLRSGSFAALPAALKDWISAPQPPAITAMIHDGRSWWFGTQGAAHVFDTETGQLRTLRLGDVGVVLALAAHPAGGVMVATSKGGARHLRPDGSSDEVQGLPGAKVNALYRDREGVWWLATDGGLAKSMTGRDAQPVVLRARDGRVFAGEVASIAADGEGGLWLGMFGQGLVSLNVASGDAELHRHRPEDRYSLPEDRVIRLFIDRDQVLWAGTQRSGLARVNLQSRRFALYRDYDGRGDEQVRNNIRALHEDDSGRIWLGTDGVGLKLMGRDGRYEDRTAPLLAALPAQHPAHRVGLRVLQIRPRSRTELWLGTSVGVFSLDTVANKAQRIYPQAGGADTTIWALLPEVDGGLWFGASGVGLLHLRADGVIDGEWRAETGTDTSVTGTMLANTLVLALHRDRYGALWIGTANGLQRLRSDGKLQTFRNLPGDAQSPAGNLVRTFTTTRDGRLWVGTHNGLTVVEGLDREQPLFRNIGAAEGLVDTTVYGLMEDDAGWLWLSSNRGLSRYSPDDGRLIHYDRRDGLQGSEFNGGAYTRTRDGRMLFGGTRGFNAFLPQNIALDPTPPPVHLLSYQLGRSEPVQVLGEPALPLRLPYEERVLSIQFVGLDSEAPDRVEYRYRLKGFDQDWVDAGRRHELTYTNLDAGEYELEVLAANHDGLWSQDGLRLPIVVVPPMWLSVWAKGGYALAGLLVIGWFWWTARSRQRERARAEAAIRQSEERLKWAVWASGDSLWDWDVRTGRIYRDGLDRLLGYPADSIENSGTWRDRLIHPDDAALVPAALQKHLAGETEYFESEYRMRASDGRWVWVLDRGKVIERDNAGHPVRLAGTMKDVTDRKRYEDELRHLANYDTLTHLPNRTLFMERLRHALAHARRLQQRLAVLFFDLDRFKQINDSLGHAAGDNLLKQVARRISDCVREDDTVARLGGDEFTVILENLPTAQSGAIVADKVLQAFRTPFELDGHEVVISPSIGISLFPEDGDDVATLIKNADLAMYHAKEQGRNNYQYFVAAMNQAMRRRLSLETALRRAIEHREFTLYYQPKMEISTGAITGMEALLRWDSAELGRVPPDEFIPLAEDNGLIVPIGEWVLREACTQIARWRAENLPVVPVAVNLSIRQLMAGDMAELVAGLLREFKLDPQFLQLEITESLVMANAAQSVGRLNALRDIGVRLAVDDFGTGYSSLSYLKRLPIDTIKIDKAFIRDLSVDPDDATITRTIIAMAHSLKLTVVAEGVETTEQLQFLREHGCEEMQGYWLSKPLPADQLIDILRRHW